MKELKFALVASEMYDNQLEKQLQIMQKWLKECADKKADIVLFGESYLQGFEGLSWNYKNDLKRALSIDSSEINFICSLAKEYQVALSFGFIEKANDLLYSSNLFIDNSGKIINCFRRLSPGWKEKNVSAFYQEGSIISPFVYKDCRIATAICGDLWDKDILSKYKNLAIDVLLWPLYVDYGVSDWEKEILDDYKNQIKDFGFPVLLINSYVKSSDRANGGCYVFNSNNNLALKMGKPGILYFNYKY